VVVASRLSVNVNKVATLRNSRGGQVPDVVSAAQACVSAGAGGITVHPRADGRHITSYDVRVLNTAFAGLWGEGLEFNIEGDPRPDWMAAVRFAKACGADRVELYTEPFAQAFQQGKTSCEESFDRYAQAARLAHELGLGVNAGHDLDRHNLIVLRNLPHLDEVSIGHAIWAEALFHGIDYVVSHYLALLAADPR
jgi:pyridoxine 5-phosphate synthase